MGAKNSKSTVSPTDAKGKGDKTGGKLLQTGQDQTNDLQTTGNEHGAKYQVDGKKEEGGGDKQEKPKKPPRFFGKAIYKLELFQEEVFEAYKLEVLDQLQKRDAEIKRAFREIHLLEDKVEAQQKKIEEQQELLRVNANGAIQAEQEAPPPPTHPTHFRT